MVQIWIYSHKLERKEILQSDIKIKVYDCETPQLTTINIPKNTNIEDNDIIMVKDENTYIGIIESNTITDASEVAMYPLEHIFDNDLQIDTLDGTTDVVTWLQTQITRNFINTDDELMKLPITFQDLTETTITYKSILETDNLLEVINEIYLNTGVYMEYEPVYTAGVLTSIKIVFKNVGEQPIRQIRYDNPQIVDKITYDFCNTNTTKVTIYDTRSGTRGTPYKIYLREDNELTTNPNDEHRIKKVINKNIDFTETENGDGETLTDDEVAEAMITTAQSELKSDIFGYKIEFTMLINARRKWSYRQACIFTSETKTFNALVTRIEYLSDRHIKITLGAYRTKLHEKIQKLMKPAKELGTSLGGITVTNGLGKYTYWFEKDAQGNLYVCSDGYTTTELNEMFELDSSKNLYVNYGDTQRESLSIDTNGNLVGGY